MTPPLRIIQSVSKSLPPTSKMFADSVSPCFHDCHPSPSYNHLLPDHYNHLLTSHPASTPKPLQSILHKAVAIFSKHKAYHVISLFRLLQLLRITLTNQISCSCLPSVHHVSFHWSSLLLHSIHNWPSCCSSAITSMCPPQGFCPFCPSMWDVLFYSPWQGGLVFIQSSA